MFINVGDAKIYTTSFGSTISPASLYAGARLFVQSRTAVTLPLIIVKHALDD